jgi:hypothetical protein
MPASFKTTRVPARSAVRCEGCLRIVRFNPYADPTKFRYAVTFTPYLLGSVRGIRGCYLDEEGALGDFLGRLGVTPEAVERALDDLRLERKTTVPDVVLSSEALEQQGLIW